MIIVTPSDLPFLRFVKRHQLAVSCLRRISDHPLMGQLEGGISERIEFDFEASEKELALLENLKVWWEKAEYQGISTRLLTKLTQPLVKTEALMA